MKSRIICLVLSLAVVVGLFCADGAYAWFFVNTGGTGSGSGVHQLASGNIGFTIYGGMKSLDGEKIMAEVELLDELSQENAALINNESCKMFLMNTSTIETQLRIRIEYTYGRDENTQQATTQVYEVTENNDSPLAVSLTQPENWVYHDGYLYYKLQGASDEAYSADPIVNSDVLAAVTPGNAQYIPLFNHIYYSGPNSTQLNKNENSTVRINVIFQARQSEFVDWETVGEIPLDTPTV